MVCSGHAFFASYLTHPPLYYRLHTQKVRIEDETHHTVVGHHGPDPVDSCRGGPSGEQDRHSGSRLSTGHRRSRPPGGQGRERQDLLSSRQGHLNRRAGQGLGLGWWYTFLAPYRRGRLHLLRGREEDGGWYRQRCPLGRQRLRQHIGWGR